MLTESGDLRGAGTADEGEGEIAACDHDLGGMATAQAGAIFAEGDITHEVAALDSLIANDKRADAGHGGRWA